MCGCNDQVLTFESMIVDPMFRLLLAADKLRLEDVTALYDTASQALADQQAACATVSAAWVKQQGATRA